MKRLMTFGILLACTLRAAAAIDWGTVTGDVVLSSGERETIGQAVLGNVNRLTSITVSDSAVLSFDTDSMPLVPLKGTGEVRKISSSTWTTGSSTTQQAAFDGHYVLASGIVKMSAGTSARLFGSEAATCVVADGATLQFALAALAFTTPLHISGNGAKDAGGNDLGAIRVTTKMTDANSGPKTLVLDGDALIVCTAAAYMNGATTLNGHTLTKLGNGGLNLQTGSMTGDEGGMTVGPGTSGAVANLVLKPNYSIGGDGDGPLTLESNSLFTMWNDSKVDRGIVVNGTSAKIALYDQYGTTYYKTWWTDAVRYLRGIFLNEGAELNLSPNGLAARSLSVKGTISGKGSLRVDSGSGRLFINGTENTFEGGVMLDGSAGTWVQLAGAGSFPNFGNVTGTAAKVVLRRDASAASWSDGDVGSFLSDAVLKNGSAVALNVDEMTGRAGEIVFGTGGASFGDSDASLGFGVDSQYPAAELTVAGAVAGYHPFFANTGRLRLTGNDRKEIGCLSVGEVLDKGMGSISISDADDVNLNADGPVTRLGGATSVARLNVSNAVLRGTCEVLGTPGADAERGSFVLAPGENDLAIAEVQDSVVTNVGLRVAAASGSAAHYRQRGGSLLTVGGQGDTLGGGVDYGYATKIGAGGCGSVELQNVIWTNAGHMTVADGGAGTLVVGGGSVVVTAHPLSTSPTKGAHLNIGGAASVGHLFLTNTQMTVSGTEGYAYFNYGGGLNHLTIGRDAMFSAARVYVAAARWSFQTQMVNVIDGGCLKTDRFSSLYADSKYTVPTPFWINLNGGTLVAPRASTSTFLSAGPTYRQTSRVTIYGKGARIETPYGDITSNVSIDSAPGKGIASVTVPAGGLTGYAAIPAALVVGDGEGASVLPAFDPESGTVTGFTVTSPGWNYEEAKIVLRDGRSEDRVLDCVLAENGAGAFRKAGPGVLILGKENTWTGDTVLEEGILRCGVDRALPANGTVVCAGGRLDLNGKTLSDGSAAPLKWAVDVEDAIAKGTAAVYAGDLAFPSGATLTVRNAEALDGLPATTKRVDLLTVTGTMSGTPTLVSSPMEGWRLVWRNGTLQARRNSGVVLIVR